MQVIGDGFDVHLPVQPEMGDCDEHGVLDAIKADELRMPRADALMQRKEAEQVVDELAEFAVAALDDQLGPRHRERNSLPPCKFPRRQRGRAGRALSYCDGHVCLCCPRSQGSFNRATALREKWPR